MDGRRGVALDTGRAKFLGGCTEAGALCGASLDIPFHLGLLDAQGRSSILERLILALRIRLQTRTTCQTENEDDDEGAPRRAKCP